ncbi:MAG: hypothetical protein ACXQTD_05930 [Candidatus Syntropharchaeia archaeon]
MKGAIEHVKNTAIENAVKNIVIKDTAIKNTENLDEIIKYLLSGIFSDYIQYFPEFLKEYMNETQTLGKLWSVIQKKGGSKWDLWFWIKQEARSFIFNLEDAIIDGDKHMDEDTKTKGIALSSGGLFAVIKFWRDVKEGVR